jgi:dienelactone hydrolase
MKKWLVLLFLLLVLLPVGIRQLEESDARKFEGEQLDEARYTEVRFKNTAEDIDLAGMLFTPRGDGPFPAVAIIHGSGASHRKNRWYLTLTHYLQDNGVIVLLPDKRGSEKSAGDWRNASMEDLAADTLAAVQFLTGHPRADSSRIGVIGMSQGGWIAPIVAHRSPDTAFLVNVVGSAVPPKEQLYYEENNNLRQMGFLPGISNLITYPSVFTIRKIRQKAFWDANGDFDPLPYWRELAIPSLTLYGEQDSNVPSQRSASLLRSLANPNIHVRIYAGSGHALEDPRGQGNRLFRENALRDIRSFIDAPGG